MIRLCYPTDLPSTISWYVAIAATRGPAVASRSCWKGIFLHEYIAGLLKAWGPGMCWGYADHSREVRKAKEWEIVLLVGVLVPNSLDCPWVFVREAPV